MAAGVIYTGISKDDSNDGLGVDRQEPVCRQLPSSLEARFVP
jgi:hypothetical protein